MGAFAWWPREARWLSMADTPPHAPQQFDNETRQAVFLALVNASDPMTPSAVAAETATSRELAHHHLTKLVEVGLVTRSDGEYRPQPVFTDPTFNNEIVKVVADLVPEVAARVVVSEDAGADAAQATVFNCLEMVIALNMMPPDEPLQG